MASTPEKIALGSFGKTKELKDRIIFTILMLILYRIGTYIPLAGIDAKALAQTFQTASSSGIVGMFNLFSGGALSRMTVFALNIVPYISASIIIQLLTTVIPTLESMKKEGELGRRKITQYTRYLTVFIAGLQAFGLAVALENAAGVVVNPGTGFLLTSVLTLVTGTLFLMWIGEQITSRGIGNGISLIIFAGIVANFPIAFAQLFEGFKVGDTSGLVVFFVLVGFISIILFVVFMEKAIRKIVIQYPKQQMGNRLMQGGTSFLPLKINMAGVIPAIFASSLLMLPTTITMFMNNGQDPQSATGGFLTTLVVYLQRGQVLYLLLFATLIMFFAYFYTSVTFNPKEISDNLKKSNAVVPGVRPGPNTANYLEFVVSRLTFIGASYLAFVCVLPEIFVTKVPALVYFGGTSVLILVSVTLDTVSQVQSLMMSQQYESALKKAKFGGRK